MISISHSRVQTYLSCPYAHYLRYVEKIIKRGKSRPLSFGSDFHKLLELRANKKAVKSAFKNIKESFYDLDSASQMDLGDDYLQDLKEIFVDYMKVYKGTPIPKSTEIKFDIPIGKCRKQEVIFTGIIDELYETEAGLTIGEHKTFNRKPDLVTVVMNTQKCLYAKAVHLLTGSLPQEVMWDYIKSSPAQEPVWLEKSNRFSEANNNNITAFSWERACKKRDIADPEILKKGKELYGGNIHNFFFRYTEEYIQEMVDEIFSGFKYTAMEIVRNGEKNKTRHTGPNCSWCEYKDICYAELTGSNAEYVRQRDYKERE